MRPKALILATLVALILGMSMTGRLGLGRKSGLVGQLSSSCPGGHCRQAEKVDPIKIYLDVNGVSVQFSGEFECQGWSGKCTRICRQATPEGCNGWINHIPPIKFIPDEPE